MKFVFSILVFTFGCALQASTLPPSDIAGLWALPQDGTLIRIVVHDNTADGYIERRPHDRRDEVDKFNPDPALRSRSVIGLQVLTGLTALKRQGFWKGGKGYDPDSGRTYRVHGRLRDDATLVLRGYIGIPLFGRTLQLTRVSP